MADRKPLVLSSDGTTEQLQAGDRLVDAYGAPLGGGIGPQGPVGPQGPAGPTGPQGPRGTQGVSVVLKGTKANAAAIQAIAGASPGDAWINGETGDLFFWNSTDSTWDNVGQIVGPEGPTGPTGPVGPQGPQGPQGEAVGDLGMIIALGGE